MDTKRKSPFILAGRPVGPGCPVRVMGVINVSPESFFKRSVPSSEKALAKWAETMELNGADFIDVGAMSTAPYLKTEISPREEAKRLSGAVRVLRKATSLPISIDTSRAEPAQAGFEAGAKILNDVTGLLRDPLLGKLAAQSQGVILMAHPMGRKRPAPGAPVSILKSIFKKQIRAALAAKISKSKIVLDPGIGFFRNESMPWWKWDLHVLQNLDQLKSLGFPLLVGISRKSFLGHLLGGVPPEERLSASLAATLFAVSKGVSLVRTHDVLATVQALKTAQTLSLKSA